MFCCCSGSCLSFHSSRSLDGRICFIYLCPFILSYIRANIEAHLLHFCLFSNLSVFSLGFVSSIEIQPINIFHTTLFYLPSSFQTVLISMIYQFNTKVTIPLKCFVCVCARTFFSTSLKRYVSWNHIKLFRLVLYPFTFRLKNIS